MGLLRCCNCQREIERRSQNPNQKFCNKKGCQNERKRLWRIRKRAEPGYREAEQLAQKKWRQENPGYMTDYREKHRGYVEENRRQQRLRNGLRNHKTEKRSDEGAVRGIDALIVNSDAWEGLGDKGIIKTCAFSDGTAIVNSDASNRLVPMFLVPLSRLQVIVKETRRSPSG